MKFFRSWRSYRGESSEERSARRMAIAAALSVPFAVALTVVAALQLEQLTRTNRNYEFTQRSSVYFGDEHFATVPVGDPPERLGQYELLRPPKGKAAEISVDLHNSGNAATIALSVEFACTAIAVEQIPSDPFDLFRWEDAHALPNFLASNQTMVLPPCRMALSDIEKAYQSGVAIFIVGEARYHDAFSSPRVTQFARRIQVYEFDEPTGKYAARAYSIGKHNCADADCESR
jgi:hypothetical protein